MTQHTALWVGASQEGHLVEEIGPSIKGETVILKHQPLDKKESGKRGRGRVCGHWKPGVSCRGGLSEGEVGLITNDPAGHVGGWTLF